MYQGIWIVIEPYEDAEYLEIIAVMDVAREIAPTDETLYRANEEGIDEKIEILFSNILFGNITS